MNRRMTRRLVTALLALHVHAVVSYQCMECIPGKYKSEIANNVCVQCPSHTYLNYSGADDRSDCIDCPVNMQSPYGTDVITGCICNVGFYGPPGGPCAPCQTGRYADVPGQAACTQCPANQDSPLQSDEITDCACVQGYTGPNGGVCEQCALSTYKTTTGNHSCTSCEVNTMTLQTGNSNPDSCICTPGYTGNFIRPYSTTACSRFIGLTPRPSFASVSTRNNIAVGSTILPTYNPTGGPNGKGHVNFNRANSQYLDAGPRTFNIATNGGFTIVAVVRFTGSIGDWERIIHFGSVWNDGTNNVLIAREGSTNNLKVEFFSGDQRAIAATSYGVIQQDVWLTVVVRINASTRNYWISINNAIVSPATYTLALPDRTLLEPWIGRSHFGYEPFLNADIAGLFVVDEYLGSDATSAIAEAMKQGVDLTTVCVNSCTGCFTGKYKVNPGPQACTDCVVNTYSTATEAIANTTCLSCPANTLSASGSGMLTACKCNLGYTSPSGDGLACNACVQGTYKTATGSQACTLCDLGKYSGAVALTTATCTSCDANQFTNATGKDELADCRCNAGFTGNDGTHCYQCDAGKYKSTTGDATCTLCPQDRYSTTLAATSGAACLACPTSSQSPQSSSAKAACICNMGYTGPGGSASPPTFIGYTVDMTVGCTTWDANCNMAYGKDAFAVPGNISPNYRITDGNWPSTISGDPQSSGLGVDPILSQYSQFFTVDLGSTKTVTSGRFWATLPSGARGSVRIGNTAINVAEITQSSWVHPSNLGSLCIDNLPGDVMFTCISPIVGRYVYLISSTPEPWTLSDIILRGYNGAWLGYCNACVAGTFKPTTGPDVCTNCLADTYSTAVAAISNPCVDCPLYTQSAVASGAITKCRCNAGYTGPDGAVCTGCVAGKYKTAVGSVLCSNCAPDTFSTAVNKSDASCTTCVSVTEGPSQSLAGSALQTDCKCNMGYSGSNGSQCIACPLGAFKPSVGDATCSLCPTNTYQPALARTASADCLGCPDFSLSLQASDELTDCQCQSGYFGVNGGTCSECYAGKFKPVKGPQDCDLCPNGTYSGVFAATSDGVCDSCQENSLSWAGSTVLTDCKCDSGFFTENFGTPTAYCRTCGNGTYNTHLNATACSKCAAGLYSTAIGAKTGEVCQKCASGFSGEGYAQCDACPPHATAEIASSFLTDCKCDPGYTGPDGGTCEECVTGKFKPENGSSACSNCPLHTYLPYIGASLETECVDCFDNSITLQEGSATVYDCKCSIGYTSTVSGMDGNECEACTQGKYKNTTGHYPCALCPLNTYLDATGSTVISQCEQCFSDSVSNEGSPTVESCTCVGGFERHAS